MNIAEIGYQTWCTIRVNKTTGNAKMGIYRRMRKVLDMGSEIELSDSEEEEYKHIPKDSIITVSQTMVDEGVAEIYT